MIPTRRLPATTEEYSGVALSLAPGPVRALLESVRAQGVGRVASTETGLIDQELRANTVVRHVPTNREFEDVFRRKGAHPPVVFIDRVTERLYLTGVGTPGRSEIESEKVPVRDRHGHTQYYEVRERFVEKLDRVVTFCEISYDQEREAHALAQALSPETLYGLMSFYQLPRDHPPTSLLLSVPSLTAERLQQIAQYELHQLAARGAL